MSSPDAFETKKCLNRAPTGDSGNVNTSDDERFLREVLTHRRRLYGYIYSRVPNRADAEDLLQETLLVAARQFDKFEPGSDFFAWTRRIALLKIKNFQRKHARSRVVFSEPLLEALEPETRSVQRELDAQREALRVCLEKLSERDRRMIETRYSDEGGVEEAARVSGRSRFATYKALQRTRDSLLRCIEQQLAWE